MPFFNNNTNVYNDTSTEVKLVMKVNGKKHAEICIDPKQRRCFPTYNGDVLLEISRTTKDGTTQSCTLSDKSGYSFVFKETEGGELTIHRVTLIL